MTRAAIIAIQHGIRSVPLDLVLTFALVALMVFGVCAALSIGGVL